MKKNMTSLFCLVAFLAMSFLGISTTVKADEEKETLCPACSTVTTV